jgi:hypothetical protein
MLIQNSKGQFTCEDENFKTTDVFEYLDHAGVEFKWGVKLSGKTTLDLFAMLYSVNNALLIDNLDEAYDVIQSAALLLVNASSNEVDDFIEEAVVRATSKELISGIEGMLKNE